MRSVLVPDTGSLRNFNSILSSATYRFKEQLYICILMHCRSRKYISMLPTFISSRLVGRDPVLRPVTVLLGREGAALGRDTTMGEGRFGLVLNVMLGQLF